MTLSADQIARYTQAPIVNARMYEGPLNEAMARFGITSPRNIAAFMATISVESARLTTAEESLYYKSAERLATIYKRAFKNANEAEPYVRNPAALSMLLYSGYHGRGLIQLTWKSNYFEASEDLGVDYVSVPSLVCKPEHAARTAAWFWDKKGCSAAAEEGDMEAVTRIVNGPRKLHLDERVALYQSNIESIAA